MLMEYSAVALQHMALRDFLAGPGGAVPAACRWCWARSGRSARSTTTGARSTRRPQVPPSSLDALAAQAFPVPPTTQAGHPQDAGPQRRAQPAHARTRRTTRCRSATCRRGRRSGSCCPRLDSATVSTPDGRGVTFRRRDPQLFRAQLKTLGAAAGHGGPRVARPAPPLPRGGPAPDQPRGLEADLRELSPRRPDAQHGGSARGSECSTATMRAVPEPPACSAVGVQPVQPRPVLPARQRAHLRPVPRRDLRALRRQPGQRPGAPPGQLPPPAPGRGCAPGGPARTCPSPPRAGTSTRATSARRRRRPCPWGAPPGRSGGSAARLSQVSTSCPGSLGGADDLHLAEVALDARSTGRIDRLRVRRPDPPDLRRGRGRAVVAAPQARRGSRRRPGSASPPARTASRRGTAPAACPAVRPIRRTENGGVQRRGDQAVAHVEVPVPLVPVLPPEVGVPHAGAGQRHRREAVGAGAVAELDVVPLEEQRQRVADRADDRRPGPGTPTSRCTRCRRAGPAPIGSSRARRAPSRYASSSAPGIGTPDLQHLGLGVLGADVQVRGVQQVEHLPADDRRVRGARRERREPDAGSRARAARRRP